MSEESLTGTLRKMRSALDVGVTYRIPVGDGLFPVSERVGSRFSLRYTGRMHCVACGRAMRKSFNQGYCFPCFRSLAECDMCILKPETCHYHLGTCRDPAWGDRHCMQDHIVYLANTSGIKVGITRINQIPTRWIDQGARQAIPVLRVGSRFHSGLIEAAMKAHLNDRTDWRRMLKGHPEEVDMRELRRSVFERVSDDIETQRARHPDLAWEVLDDDPVILDYPVEAFPGKIVPLNLDRQAEVSGRLLGIKGQYLITDCGVINIRKHTGYEVQVE